MAAAFTISYGTNSNNPFGTSGDQQGYSQSGFYGSPLVVYDCGGYVGDDWPRLGGAVVVVCTYIHDGGSGHFVIALHGTLAQNVFSSVSFVDGIGATETYSSASAVFTTSGGFSIWTWPATRSYPFTGVLGNTDFSLPAGEATSPAELYKFSYQGNYLYYTSGAQVVIYAGNAYQPYAMQRGNIKSDTSSIDQTLEITAFRDFPPSQLFRVQAPSAIINLTVYRKMAPDSGNVYRVIWIGRVLNAAWVTNSEVKLQCESDLSSMRRLSLRRRYQRGCSYALYGPGCNLNADDWRIDVPHASVSVSGRQVTIPSTLSLPPAYGAASAYPDNYFAGGYLTYFSSLTNVTEVFAIRSSAGGVLQLALTPYGLATATGVLSVFPGCNHTTAVCAGTFGNLPNYGGQPYIPDINPFAATQLF